MDSPHQFHPTILEWHSLLLQADAVITVISEKDNLKELWSSAGYTTIINLPYRFIGGKSTVV